MSLLLHLTVLSTEATPPRMRNASAADVDRLLARWAPGYLRGEFRRIGDQDIEDARQHVLLKASTGTSRFHGTTEGEAWAWCKTVLRNFILDRIDTVNGPGGPETPPPMTSQTSIDVPIDEILEKAEQAIHRLHPTDGESLVDSFRCHVEHRLGATTAEQIETWGYRGEYEHEARNHASWKRARNRVYAYRRRGSIAGWGALHALATQGVYTLPEIDVVLKLVGQPKHGKPRKHGSETN